MNRPIRAALDHYRTHGAAGWLKGHAYASAGSIEQNPVALVTQWGDEDDAAERTAAIDALIFAAPECGNARAMSIWFMDDARTFGEIMDVITAADAALNGGADV